MVLACVAGCSSEPNGERSSAAAGPTERAETAPPTLQPAWSLPGQFSNPQSSGRHHWAVHRVQTSGAGRSTISLSGPLLTVDARTGRVHRYAREDQRFVCAMPTLVADDGTLPVLWSQYRRDPYTGLQRSEPCTRMTVLDASGRLLWARTFPRLPGAPDARVLGAHEGRVALVGPLGRSTCLAGDDGAPLDAEQDPACQRLTSRLDRTDVPTLRLPDGSPVPFAADLWDDRRITELGRTDEVIVLRTERPDRDPVVRAHDLTTGETLWERDQPEGDPHTDDAWDRDETWATTPTRVLHVTYDHPRDPAEAASTPMRISEVDPRSGEDVRALGLAPGAWFNRQVGEVTVALTEQQLELRSTISGFVLPSP